MMTQVLRIRGKVQGVGYRDAMRREACRLRLTGWVRNCPDGSVEAVVQGEAQSLAALLAWAHKGPPAARVEGVTVYTPAEEHQRLYRAFEIWPTA